MSHRKSTFVISGLALLVGLLVGAFGASLYEREKATQYAEWLHVEMAIACRSYPRIQAGSHSICNLAPVVEQMEYMARRTGKPTIRWEDIKAAEEAERDNGMAEVQATIDAMNAERDAFIAECMAETIKTRDEMRNDPEMAEFAEMFASVGNQDVNNCARRYNVQQQDKRLREKYAPSD